MCQTVAVIYAGEVIEYGTARDIFNHPTHPYTIGLFGSLIVLDEDVERLSPIPGLMPDPTDLPKGCKFAPRCPTCEERCQRAAPEAVEIGEGHLVKCFRAKDGE